MADKSLAVDVQLVLDYQEIENLANLYRGDLNGGHFDQIVSLFAQKTPGVKVETMWGVYEGIKGVKKLYPGLFKSFRGEKSAPGDMFQMKYSDTVIEIAGDGKTAKAVARCTGNETWRYEGKLQAFWVYGNVAFDFIKEDDVWKIWHHHVYGGYYADYDKSWVDEPRDYPVYPGVDKYPPDKPCTTYWMYNPRMAVPYQPVPPEPYKTFDEKTAY
jgi:hypothetical protein